MFASKVIPKNRLRDKVCIVTGSTAGIGFAIAKRLALEGAKVIISSRKQEHVEKAVSKLVDQNLDVTGLVCHVSNAEDRKRLLDEANNLGGVDILISNAAANPAPGPILESTEDVWDKVFDVNVKASFLLCKEVLPSFLKKGGGNIVFISSFIAYQSPSLSEGGLGIYSVSKTALLGLTKALALETATKNIRVNCVCPGPVRTKFGNYMLENEAYLANVIATIPMQRYAEPDEISGAVAFLVSDDANYITGETIVVSGGGPSRL